MGIFEGGKAFLEEDDEEEVKIFTDGSEIGPFNFVWNNAR